MISKHDLSGSWEGTWLAGDVVVVVEGGSLRTVKRLVGDVEGGSEPDTKITSKRAWF